jgi:hypothetical protein
LARLSTETEDNQEKSQEMKSTVYLIVSLYLLAFPSFTQAGAGWTEYVRISELIPTSRHYYEVRLPVKNNPSGCTDKIWFYQDYVTIGSDKMFETLLRGLQSGSQVRVYVTGKCNINGYSEFISVGIIP